MTLLSYPLGPDSISHPKVANGTIGLYRLEDSRCYPERRTTIGSTYPRSAEIQNLRVSCSFKMEKRI